MSSNNPIIVALDVENAAEARRIVNAVGDAASFYKVGLELYASAGIEIVRELKGQGKHVFLDLKLYDIGETVKRAVVQIAKSGADYLTIHAMRQVMQAAAAGRGDSAMKLLGVTVLTSVDDRDLAEDGYTASASELVDRRVRNAMADGVEGIVCSALDVARVRRIYAEGILVIPGVRSSGAAVGDQKRVATPAQAIADGADHLVIGRQVTRSSDPRGEVLKVLDEIAAVRVGN
jgi:orotidine-5'-phosphate decarboxylase